ncbi:unnamed protein product [Acanthoscelides obtectus]|uniref:Uncharacterized protein n=1 Tax=Acanthoscelides obtectus TaxID=200917 RepID=A0A9P0JLQ6_ACAOB|nr:unnamed protein product [Acanthoscelides obtectus]CAK1661443.1 hypothetical protein AOBTE_LOCUS22626 [Acanthoscelides obtectus]
MLMKFKNKITTTTRTKNLLASERSCGLRLDKGKRS